MKIGLIGNPNSGKTTLFNLLTGNNAKVGNWPGVTIEKKVGKIKKTNHEITDLPGIYSLSPYSLEEEVSRKYIFEEKPDVLINIVDSTSFERSMYLTLQLLELDVKVIVALNMADIMEKRGIKIDIPKLEKILKTKVIKISALKKSGIDELIKEVENKEKEVEKIAIFDDNIEKGIKKIKTNRFIAVKLLEQDKRYKTNDKIHALIKNLEKNYEVDLEEEIATQRYQYIEKIKKMTYKKINNGETITDKLDKIMLNKWLAYPIFILIMFLVYYLSVGVIGSFTVEWVLEKVDLFSGMVRVFFEKLDATEWLISLLTDGIIAGVGAVLGFIPQLCILFLCIAILETTGYMSRISLLLDNMFRKIGLSGKSLIPFIVGSGCSVPGIMGTRIIENKNEREMTTILTPFIPCSAKLPIIILFTSYFFKENAGLVAASLYFLAILIIIFSALLMKKFIYKGDNNNYIVELPEYKAPKLNYILRDVTEKITEFIKRAGSVILICSIFLWFLLSFSLKMEYGVDIEDSILASIGKLISWIFYPMLGVNNWGTTVSAIQGLVAKEQVISSMTVIAGFTEESSNIFNNDGIFGFFTPASAYSFMIFNLFSAPCFGAIGAMKRELGSNKKLFLAISFQTLLAYLLATLTYQIATVNIGNVLIILVIILLLFIFNTKKNKCRCCPLASKCNKTNFK